MITMDILAGIDSVLDAQPDLFENVVEDLFPDNGYQEGKDYEWATYYTGAERTDPIPLHNGCEFLETGKRKFACVPACERLDLPFVTRPD